MDRGGWIIWKLLFGEEFEIALAAAVENANINSPDVRTHAKVRYVLRTKIFLLDQLGSRPSHAGERRPIDDLLLIGFPLKPASTGHVDIRSWIVPV